MRLGGHNSETHSDVLLGNYFFYFSFHLAVSKVSSRSKAHDDLVSPDEFTGFSGPQVTAPRCVTWCVYWFFWASSHAPATSQLMSVLISLRQQSGAILLTSAASGTASPQAHASNLPARSSCSRNGLQRSITLCFCRRLSITGLWLTAVQ